MAFEINKDNHKHGDEKQGVGLGQACQSDVSKYSGTFECQTQQGGND